MRHAPPPSSQAGFSMVELLVAAFIMAVGLLGLTMLQTLAIRTSTGSKSNGTALRVGQLVVDQVRAEARRTLAYGRNNTTAPTVTIFATDDPVKAYFDFNGNRQDIDTPNADTFFTVVVTPAALSKAAVNVGGMKTVNVTVTYKDTPNPRNPGAVLERKVSFNTQVAYVQ